MARSNRRSKPAPGWVWMLFGLTLGLVVAAGVYFRGAAPSASRTTDAPRQAAARTPETPAARGAAKSPAASERAESRFDFYDLLPQYEVVIPEVETAASPAARAKPVEEPGSYILQAASFNNIQDADRLQASLALLGIESRIQRVAIDDDIYHRVRIGPITDLDTLNRIRKQLRDARIDPLLMKVPK